MGTSVDNMVTHKRDTKGQAQRGWGCGHETEGVCWTCGDATAHDTPSPQKLSGPLGAGWKLRRDATVSDSLSESPQPA